MHNPEGELMPSMMHALDAKEEEDKAKRQILADNIRGARGAFTTINQIANSLRREPADTGRMKRANESMEFHLRNLEELISAEEDIAEEVHRTSL